MHHCTSLLQGYAGSHSLATFYIPVPDTDPPKAVRISDW